MYSNVTFKVKAPSEKVFICGRTKSLGEWDATKAVELEKSGEIFTAKKRFTKGENVEFKVLCGKCWSQVEKGCCGEEIENRCFVADTFDLNIEVAGWNC